MTRLQKYMLNEAKPEVKLIETFKSFYPKLYKDCKPFIEDFKRSKSLEFLCRGVERKIDTYRILKSYVKTGRKPKDTPQELHDLLNNMFYKRFKWNVRDGVSVIGEGADLSHDYGTRYLFFPIGRYKFAWSPNIADLWSKIEEDGYDVEEFDEGSYEYEYEQEYGEGCEGHWEYDGDKIGDIGDTMYDLIDKLEDEGKEYDRYKFEWIPDVEWDEYITQKEKGYTIEREDYLKSLIRNFKYIDLLRAIKSKHEILFNCDKYYLVNKIYDNLLTEVLISNTDFEDLVK